MFDSLRNEFLNEFGGECPRNFVDEMISQGVSFTNCHGTAPFTIVSMASKMTSCYPSLNRMDGWLKKNPIETMNPLCLSFPEILRFNGYKTFYMSSSDSCTYINPQGFDFYHAQNGYTDFPLDEYVKCEGPKFIYIDFADLHDYCCNNVGKFYKKDCYDGIRMTVKVIESFYEKIKTDNDLIMITSDHGMRTLEDFTGSRYANEFITGRYLTEKTTHNSFNLIWKDHLRPSKYNNFCRGVDIMPTVLDILGFEYPNLDGKSLYPVIKGEPFEDSKYSFSITGWSCTHPATVGAWCVCDKQFKYLITEHVHGLRRYKTYELFDYVNNPEEDIDVKNEYSEKYLELKEQADKMFFGKRSLEKIYEDQGFDIDKYLRYRKEHLNHQVTDYANNLIKNNWQKKVRSRFLKGYYVRTLHTILYWQFRPLYNLLVKMGKAEKNPDFT